MTKPIQYAVSQGLVLGTLLQLIGWIMRNVTKDHTVNYGGKIVIILGTAIFVRGCMILAERKGISKWFGLLGIAAGLFWNKL
jgi:hypothetical protein